MTEYQMFISIEDYALRFEKHRLIHYHMSKALNHHRDIAIDAIQRGYPINKYDDVGHTLLWCAVVNNGLDIVELLLKNGADPNMKSRQHGDETGTLFHHIVLIGHRRGWLEIPDIKERFELLLKYGANPNLKNARGNNVITHIKYYMRLWSKKTCWCSQIQKQSSRCNTFIMVKLLNSLINCILNYQNKNKTLFELMLPQIKKYKPAVNNKRRRK